MPKKYVYFFGGKRAEGKAEMKELLGGKGANLAEMSKAIGNILYDKSFVRPKKSLAEVVYKIINEKGVNL